MYLIFKCYYIFKNKFHRLHVRLKFRAYSSYCPPFSLPLLLRQSVSAAMVFLHQQGGSSRKRHSSFNSPYPQQKIHKSTTDFVVVGHSERTTSPPQSQPQPAGSDELLSMEKMVSILAEAGCTLINPAGPPCLPTDHHKFRCHLHRTFTSGATHRSDFLDGLSIYTDSPINLRR